MFKPLPDWLKNYQYSSYLTQTDKMALAIDLARKNIENKTGGPFGAAIFCENKLVSVGVNLVVSQNCPIYHAEMIAIILADKRDFKDCELFTSVAPCAMCLGATGWANFKRIICGAREEDARAIGFDEGEKPENWQTKFNIVEDVLRDESIEVLKTYKKNGGEIY